MKKYIKQYVIGAFALTSLFSAQAQDLKLSVGEAVKMAMENNKLLQAQKYQEQFARESTKESVGYLLPSLSVHGSYSYFFDRQVIFMPGSFAGNESKPVVDVAVGGKNAFYTHLSLQQPILAEAMRRQVKTSKLNESIEQLKTSDQMAGLDVDVTSQYFTILLVKKSLELHQQSLDRNRRPWRIPARFYDWARV
jgi:outer membrane protein